MVGVVTGWATVIPLLAALEVAVVVRERNGVITHAHGREFRHADAQGNKFFS